MLHNEPDLSPAHPDHAQEAGVLVSVEAMGAVLAQAGHRVRRLGVRADPGELMAGLQAPWRPAVVVNLCEGFGGGGSGEAAVAGIIELMGISFTGSGSRCLSLVRHKGLTKALLRGAGLPTPDWVWARAGEPFPYEALAALVAGGPVIVKPADEDASLGIGADAVVADLEGARSRVVALRARFGDVLVERYVEGREVNAGWVDGRVLPLAEVVFHPSGPQFLSYDAKWDEASDAWAATPVVCPADLEPGLAAEIARVAGAAAALVGCRDYARIDLRVDRQGRPWILEVNGNPDLGPGAGLARMVRAAGGSVEAFYLGLVEGAAARGDEGSTTAAPALRGGDVPLRALRDDDMDTLVDMLSRTRAFRPDEVEVGREVLEEAQRDGAEGHYKVRVAEHGGHPVGWTAYGLVPLSDGAWDLYWIAVDPGVQGLGVGRALIADCEADVRARGGRWVLAETSGTDAYDATCAFYRRCGYAVVSYVADFYRVGDARVTFGKRVDG